MNSPPTRNPLKAVPPTQMELLLSSVGVIKALLHKQIIPTLNKLVEYHRPETLHNPFVELSSEAIQQSPGQEVSLLPQLEFIASMLGRLEKRIEDIDSRVSRISTTQPTSDPDTPTFIPTDMIDRNSVRDSKIEVKEQKDNTAGVDEASEALKALRKPK